MAKDTKKPDDAKKAAEQGLLEEKKSLEAAASELPQENEIPSEPEPDEALIKAGLAAQATFEAVMGLVSADPDDIEGADLRGDFKYAAKFLRQFADVPPAALASEIKRRGGDQVLAADDKYTLMAWESFTAVFRVAYKLISADLAETAPAQTGQPEAIPLAKRGKIRAEAYQATGFDPKPKRGRSK